MAEKTSITYCDSEEETFFGSVTDKELTKSAAFGQNYFSPVVNSSTPRGGRPKSSALLPDVLKRSTCKSFNKDSTRKEYSKHDFDSYLSYGDQGDCSAYRDKGDFVLESSSMMTDDGVKTTEELIDLTDSIDLSGSVSGLSDLQEFQIDKYSGEKRNTTADTIELDNSSLLYEPDPDYKHNNQTAGSDISERVINKSVRGIQTPKKENYNKSTCSINTSDLGFKIEGIEAEDNKSICTIDSSDLGNAIEGIRAEINKSGIDEFLSVNDNSVISRTELPPSPVCNKSSVATDQSYRTGFSDCQANKTDLSSFTESNTFQTANQSSEGHVQDLFNLQKFSMISPSHEFNEITGNKSEISEHEYQSINAISDSILNISHGSSIANLSVKCDSQVRSPLPNVVYEDISCDGEHLDLTNKVKDNVSTADHVDLHMSVDEPDTTPYIGLVNHFEASVNSSQSSMYKSCTNTSVGSSYCTAHNAESRNPSILQEPLSQFYSYRDTNSGSPIEGIPTVSNTDLEVAEENKNESSFEIIAQNRQNSFTKSPENKPTDTVVEQVKPKPISKLPVFNTSTSLLKPPKIQVKTNNLISHNYLWAKNLPKEAVKKTNLNSDKPGESKIGKPNLKSKIPSNTFESKPPSIKCQIKTIATPSTQTNIAPLTKTPSDKIVNRVLTKSKTPAENKTPGQSLMRQPSRLVKSACKLPRTMTPVNKIDTMSEKKGQLKNSPVAVLQDKDRYKNVISPIRAYISGSPSVLIKKANPSVETLIVSNELGSRLPKKVHTPLRAPKAVQKLNYGCLQERENVNPNHSRDTLPPRIFQTADAIFLKEPEQPRKHLPKMGMHMQRMLDTPRPKIIVHQGRVNESPTTKGILISSSDKSPASRISVRVLKSAEKSDTLN